MVVTIRLRSTRVDRGTNPIHESQRLQTHRTTTGRLLACAHRGDEGAPLRFERLNILSRGALQDTAVVERDPRRAQIGGRDTVPALDTDASPTLGVHPAGSQTNTAARREYQPRLGLVDPSAPARAPGRLELDDLLIEPPRDPVEVVEHQVLDHVDIESATAGGIQALDLDPADRPDLVEGSAPGRIEPLDVPDLQDPVLSTCDLDERSGLVEGSPPGASRRAGRGPARRAETQSENETPWARPRSLPRPDPPARQAPRTLRPRFHGQSPRPDPDGDQRSRPAHSQAPGALPGPPSGRADDPSLPPRRSRHARRSRMDALYTKGPDRHPGPLGLGHHLLPVEDEHRIGFDRQSARPCLDQGLHGPRAHDG